MLSCTDPLNSISIVAQSILLDFHSLLQVTLVHREIAKSIKETNKPNPDKLNCFP